MEYGVIDLKVPPPQQCKPSSPDLVNQPGLTIKKNALAESAGAFIVDEPELRRFSLKLRDGGSQRVDVSFGHFSGVISGEVRISAAAAGEPVIIVVLEELAGI